MILLLTVKVTINDIEKIVFILFALFFAGSTFAQKYVQVWGDEFNSPGLPDSTKWNYEIGKVRNSELQYYTSKRLENARVEDSVLIIEARKEPYKGANYTSASIISKGIGDWEYGKIEIRAKVPAGKGTWPALWMLPTYNEYGGWPLSGEIDIMEYIGVEPQSLWYTAHFKGEGNSNHKSSGSGAVNSIQNPFDQFITFTLIWTPEKLEWFANGVKYHEYKKPADDYRIWPFNKKFYLILNLAYGGSWGGMNGVNDALLPHRFLIDYVRVYQLQNTESPFSLTISPTNGGRIEVTPQMNAYPENTKVTVTALPDSGYVFQAWKNRSGANPFSFIIRKNTVLTPLLKKKSELISNGTFEEDFHPWQFYVNNSALTSYTAKIENGRFITNITKSPGTNWKLGFQELGISLKKGKYKLTFDAFATQPNTLLLMLSKNYPDWSSFVSKYVAITTKDKSYEVEFTMPTNDNNTRLFFGIGKFTGSFSIDNISFSQINELATNSSINRQNRSTGFTVYPNPNNGVFFIKPLETDNGNHSELKVYNIVGKIIYEENHIQQKSKIEIHSPSGIYFVKLISGKRSSTKKIIVAKKDHF